MALAAKLQNQGTKPRHTLPFLRDQDSKPSYKTQSCGQVAKPSYRAKTPCRDASGQYNLEEANPSCKAKAR